MLIGRVGKTLIERVGKTLIGRGCSYWKIIRMKLLEGLDPDVVDGRDDVDRRVDSGRC